MIKNGCCNVVKIIFRGAGAPNFVNATLKISRTICAIVDFFSGVCLGGAVLTRLGQVTANILSTAIPITCVS